MLGMHWGTFDLTDEPLDLPPRELRRGRRAASADPARVRALAIGEVWRAPPRAPGREGACSSPRAVRRAGARRPGGRRRRRAVRRAADRARAARHPGRHRRSRRRRPRRPRVHRCRGHAAGERRSLHVFYERRRRASATRPIGAAAALRRRGLRPRGARRTARRRADPAAPRPAHAALLPAAGRSCAICRPDPSRRSRRGDERGIDRLALAREGLRDAVRLVVPGLGWTAILSASGEPLGRLEVGARANYYVPRRPGPLSGRGCRLRTIAGDWSCGCRCARRSSR